MEEERDEGLFDFIGDTLRPLSERRVNEERITASDVKVTAKEQLLRITSVEQYREYLLDPDSDVKYPKGALFDDGELHKKCRNLFFEMLDEGLI